MASRYLITGGSSVTWDATTTSIWSTSSGGATGASVPGSSDAVIMDGSSGGGTVALAYDTIISSLNMGAFTGTFDAAGFNPTMASFSSTGAGVRTLLMGSGTWTLTGNATNIWTTTGSSNFTLNAGTSTINCSYTGSTGTRTFSPTLAVNNVNVTGGTDTFSCSGISAANLDFTGFSGTFAGSSTLTLSGGITLSPTSTITFTGTTTFNSTAAGFNLLASNGKSYASSITFNGVGGSWQLADDFSNAGTTTLTNGTFDANNFNVTTNTFSSSNSNTRSIRLGNGTWTLVGTGTVWNLATTTGLTLAPGNSTIKINDSSASSKTFSGGGQTYYRVWLTGTGSGEFDFVGSNTFYELLADNPPHTIKFTAGTTTTVTKFTVSGTAGNLFTIDSITASTHTLTKVNPGRISSDYLSISHSTATPSATWYAGANSTDGGSNSGWIFTVPPEVGQYFGNTAIRADIINESTTGLGISFDKQIQLKSYTTTQRDALTPSAGLLIYNSTTAQAEKYEGGAWGPFGTGNVTGQASSVDGEIALFSGTTGKIIKRATTTGILKGTSGVIGAAAAGTDYLAPNGSGAALTGITESQVTNLVSDLAAKATDSLVVHLAGGETITGAKTFSSSPLMSSILDTNGVTVLGFIAVASAANYLTFTNSVSSSPIFGVAGTSSNIGFLQLTKGTGVHALRPGSNSTSSFQAQNAAGNAILRVDSTNSRVAIGATATAPAATLDVQGGATISGSLTLNTAGGKINIATGSNASVGTGTLVGGTATISTTAVTALSLIFLTDTATSITNVGTLTAPSSGITAGTSFIVTSTLALDTSTFNWHIIN